jgi:hypothetical protein
MSDEIVYPQDPATGVTDGSDWDDAGGFAFHEDSLNERDYVVAGLEFTVNWSTNTLNVSEGKAKLYQAQTKTNDHSGDGGPAPKMLKHAVFTVQPDNSGDLSLSDNATNHVFIGLNQQENDDYIWQVNTDNTPPSEPYLKLGTVDTGTELIKELNRAPAGRFRELRVK